MNRFVLGTVLVVLASALSGCSNSTFYVTAAPTPFPTPTPAPTPIEFPFDAMQGTTVAGGTSKGIAMNGVPNQPTSFRVADVADIQFGARSAGDKANASLLLVLQPLNPAPIPTPTPVPKPGAAKPGAPVAKPGAPAAKGAAPATATGALLIGGVKDVNNPVRLAGVIVPGPSGAVGGGLQDPDQIALQAEASRRLVEAVSRWVRLAGTYALPTPLPGTPIAPTATPAPTPKSTPRGGARGRVAATPVPLPPSPVDVSQSLDVFQDPKYPVDYDSRPLVQIFFKSEGGGAIKKDTALSLNRMLIRSGLAVVDLYSPTSFDQQTWLLDEAYARHRKLGIWGMELNGKTLSLQQRVPSPSTGTGALSTVPVVSGAPGTTPPAVATTKGKLGAPTTSATQSPVTLTPTLAPTAFSRVVTGSGSAVVRGPSNTVKLPPPSAGGSVSAPVGNPAAGGGPGGKAPGLGGLPNGGGPPNPGGPPVPGGRPAGSSSG